MEKNALKNKSSYAGCCIILTTKHAKSIAIAPPFLEKLGASILEYVVDTDTLGTFSGEIERKGNALECARRKCEWSLNKLGDKIEFALASEGSFGTHPLIPFLPCNREILYFIDCKQKFHLHISSISEKTNYLMQSLDSFEELQNFAKNALFPSHALILRPHNREVKAPIFKGIQSLATLEEAFYECVKYSADKKVWAETDMRAQFNPSRMAVIGELASELANRLQMHCPKCNTSGWGKVRQEKGLNCGWCGSETALVKAEIFGCVKCDYEEKKISGEKEKADPSHCPHCNP